MYEQPYWSSPPEVWLKSEYLDRSNLARFGHDAFGFEQPSWPIGLQRGGHPRPQIEDSVAFESLDTAFDDDACCAWQLPLRYSRMGLGSKRVPLKANSNWLMRSIGRWNGSAERYQELSCRFDPRSNFWKQYSNVRTGYALTPFCIITQSWLEDPADASRTTPLFCDVALYYTFETFIQESLALEGWRGGVDQSKLTAAYEHLYSRVRPHQDLMLSDPERFRLAKVAKVDVDWSEIVDLQFDDADIRQSQAERRDLFVCRRQSHLMLAVAAACIGIPALGALDLSSLIKTARSPFALDELASSWLKHVTSDANYAGECEKVLLALARRCGVQLVSNESGLLIPESWLPATPVEEVVGARRPPILLSHSQPEAYDRYRWFLFEPSLDHSIRGWKQKLKTLGRR